MIPKKIWTQKSCDTVSLNVKSFVHISNNCPCEKDDNNLYLFYNIIRRQWANDTSSLREITQEGNPVICTPWVPIHRSFNRSAGAAPLCLSGAYPKQYISYTV
jgi:hypothetical protein